MVVAYGSMVSAARALLNRIEAVTAPDERKQLLVRSSRQGYTAMLIPIRYAFTSNAVPI